MRQTGEAGPGWQRRRVKATIGSTVQLSVEKLDSLLDSYLVCPACLLDGSDIFKDCLVRGVDSLTLGFSTSCMLTRVCLCVFV